MVNPPIPPWFWRGVNNNQNALCLECFMDELPITRSIMSFRRYGTDHHGRNNASSRCEGRVCNESDCWPDTYWRQPLPHVTLPGSLARPARHLLARGLGRGEVRFRRSENAPRCIPAPLLPYSTRKPGIKL